MSLFLRETEINLSRTSSQISINASTIEIDIEIELAGSILSNFQVNPAGTDSLVS
jgi:hypothetical protein